MKLGSKTFLYSVVIALIVGVVIFSYMIFLMPAMYTDYKEKQNIESSRTAMHYFKEHESLKNVQMGDSNTIGVIIPKQGYTIKITGVGFDGKIEVISPSARELLDKLRTLDMDDAEKSKALFKEYKPAIDSIISENTDEIKKNFNVEIKGKGNSSNFKTKGYKIHYYSGDVGIGEFTVQSRYSGTSYTCFVGLTKQDNNTLIMVNSVVTPTAKDILPVLYGATPMLVLLMVILAFGVSALYSKKIVEPIKNLSMDAERRMADSAKGLEPLVVTGKDEISDLTVALNLLYEKQAQAVSNLEEENKRKEVYMRATSHQLKTPITASLLLVDGMIGNIGKFGDRDQYLPEVKSQLKEMMSIIDEASNINGMIDSKESEQIDVESLCREIIEKIHINADAKGLALQVESPEKTVYWQNNSMVLKKILENLITNGIDHTKETGYVKITIEEKKISVFNSPGHIDVDIIDNIFEPFVTGIDDEETGQKKGHGLGLYIAKYFAGKQELELKGENLQNGVNFILQKRGRDD